ncbi:NicO-domain-containing protein [Sanghuangporus baumii]|uniref:Nickel/cobalt efflux system n=1 Tax=Sanghuangporus baumii TaxID=108892 RepID=A0A9Q5HUZ3_SANBA|nr:NicO-domain-containing protein [Sanghuangporus baumii]
MPSTRSLTLLRDPCLKWKLTLFGRSLLLIFLELVVNAVCWIAAGIAFGRRNETRSTLNLALLAWTIGLRHGLDADHISAIDNATRGLISMGQLPVTCGLFFSLGHSTIVIVVNIAIAISTDVYDRISGVGDVGGIVGAAVSGSFLFIIGLANSIILYKIIRKRRRKRPAEAGEDEENKSYSTVMMKILGPVTRFVDRPWKMYPVGVLFGFGFDTASSIALLAVTALAQRDAEGKGIPRHDIVILPLLFTAGMTLVDSADSVLMLYAYAGVPDRAFALVEKRIPTGKNVSEIVEDITPDDATPAPVSPLGHISSSQPEALVKTSKPNSIIEDIEATPDLLHNDERDRGNESVLTQRARRVKQHTMSDLSIALTLISILVAFSISLITIMALIGENCDPCQRAAEDPDGGGLAGSWWRAWAKVTPDQSGYIGAAIVGVFVAILVGWYGGRWALRKMKKRRNERIA